MKKLFLSIMAALTFSGCLIYSDPPRPAYNDTYEDGCVTFCDEYGCRQVCGRYYYDAHGNVIYWDEHFGCWIGPRGYWRHGSYYHGFHPGYHNWYHRHYVPNNGFRNHRR
jgi:hypothetical protein